MPLIAIKNLSIVFETAVFANDTFEIDLYNGVTLGTDTLRNFDGKIVIFS